MMTMKKLTLKELMLQARSWLQSKPKFQDQKLTRLWRILPTMESTLMLRHRPVFLNLVDSNVPIEENF